MTYELYIYSKRGKENFRALFYKERDKLYYRVKYDRFDYEQMIEQFLSRGSIRVHADERDYQIERTLFEDVTEIKEYLINEGFNVKLIEIPDDFTSLSIVVDGTDLNPQVISIKESEKILQFANLLYQYSNNVSYSPKYKERASSFAIDIQEQDINIDKIQNFFNHISSQSIDMEEYFKNSRYRVLVQALDDLLKIKTLQRFSIKFHNDQPSSIDIDIDSLKEFIKRLHLNIRKRPFTTSFKTDQLRAFDDKKLRVTLDLDRKYSLHIKDKAIYQKLKGISANKTIIPLNSYYISTQTISLKAFRVR